MVASEAELAAALAAVHVAVTDIGVTEADITT